MEGFLEKRVDGRWVKYWCSLKDGCLCFYVTPNDQISADATDLSGYRMDTLVDKIQGKRFVVSLIHPDYVDILLSVDSREELGVWHQSISDILTAKARRRHHDRQAYTTNTNSGPDGPTSKSEAGTSTSSPSAQNVKHKLLAEMLRQKMELQKIRAARSGSRAWSNPEPSSGGPSQSPSGPSPTPSTSTASGDDRIRTLTRLRQRRMSTQIKMSAIQKQMEESSGCGKDKKVVFQLVRRKPDLVQSHSLDRTTHQTDLEQQFKRLSSHLQDLDSTISSHDVTTGSPSPRQEVPTNTSANRLRYSCDASLLKMAAINQAGFDSNSNEHQKSGDEEDSLDGKKKMRGEKEKNKDKDRDLSRSQTFKSSMQKLAHRTFSRAHWNKLKKSNAKSPINNNDNNTINANGKSNDYSTSLTLEKPPDVIDVTNNNHFKANELFSSSDNSDCNTIIAPPDSFRTDDNNTSSIHSDSTNENNYSNITSNNSTLPRKHRTPKERILSKLSSSHSFTQIDKIASRLRTNAASPSFFKILSSSKKDQDQPTTNSPRSPLAHSTTMSSSVPKLNLHSEPAENNENSVGNGSALSFPPSNSTREASVTNSHSHSRNLRPKLGSHQAVYSIRGNHETPETGSAESDSPRRIRSGFYSARTEKPTPNPNNRSSWSYSAVMASHRREVNPTALAEIKAFEELSSKFLGIQDT